VQFIGAHGQAFVRRLVLQPTGVEGDDCCYVVLRTEAPDGTDSEPPAAAPATVRPGHAAMLQRLTALLDRAGAEEQPPAVGVIVMEDLAGLRRTEGFGRAAELADDLGRTLPDAVPEGVEVFRIADDAFALIVEEGLARDDRQLREEIDRAVKEATGADANPPRCRVGLAVAAPAALEAPETLDLAFADALTRTLPRNSDAVDSLRHTPTRETLPHEPVAADPPRADDSTSAADADGDETPADSLSLEYKIEQALSQDGFNIMFQPIISLLGDTQENYSVLLRLEDINRLILTAAELLGPAARSGNLPEIDRWVVARALRDLSARRKAGQRIGFFLSLSAETIKDPGLLIWICDMLREHDARGRWVIFQLQERDANAQADHWAPLADGLKRIKSRIAINQFGHEPHPDRLLERVPPDFVKFAPDFAFGLADDAAKQKRLADLARLARAYGAKTIVTGVEDARALSVLWSTGIDYVQGNFLQGPSPSLDAPS
jgi:EAL domain-containing protein (putative c-di-GMP-specific phosphodiesterase class I)/GGDEF domain-containing protein